MLNAPTLQCCRLINPSKIIEIARLFTDYNAPRDHDTCADSSRLFLGMSTEAGERTASALQWDGQQASVRYGLEARCRQT